MRSAVEGDIMGSEHIYAKSRYRALLAMVDFVGV